MYYSYRTNMRTTTSITVQLHLMSRCGWCTFTTWPVVMPTLAASENAKTGVKPFMVPWACIRYRRDVRV